MIKKAFLILLCLYLYVHFVSKEDKAEWLSKGMKAYQTLVQKLNDKNIRAEAKEYNEDDFPRSIENQAPENKILKKKRSF